MNDELKQHIIQALKGTAKNGVYQFERFRAATQDLLVDYPQEKVFFSRIADEKYWSICIWAETKDPKVADSARALAAKYLQDVYGLSEERAKGISAAMVEAVFEISNGHSLEKDLLEKKRKETRKKIAELEKVHNTSYEGKRQHAEQKEKAKSSGRTRKVFHAAPKREEPQPANPYQELRNQLRRLK